MKYLLCISYRDGQTASDSSEFTDFSEAVRQFNDCCASHRVKSVLLADLEQKTIIRQFVYRNDIPVLL